MTRLTHLTILFFIILTAGAATAFAQYDPATAPQPTEPDFTIVNLPTTLRLPTHRSDFRLTHRFYGNLRKNSFGENAGNLFGLDNGAAIGLEYRFGIMRNLEAIAYRTNVNRETQFSAKWDPWSETEKHPVSVSGLFSVEAGNNFRDEKAPAVGAVVSKKFGTVAEFYANPMWVGNTGAMNLDVRRNTGYIGLGGKLHVRDAMYIVGEASPRIGGLVTNDAEYAFGIEGRVGGHVFQLNFGNNTGTTFLQTAAGGAPGGLYMGFNLSRKFY